MVDFNRSAMLSELYAHLTFPSALLALLVYVVLCSVCQIVYYRFYHPLAQFPGPFCGSFTRLWLLSFDFWNTDLRALLIRLHEKYGPVIRISPTLLHFNDPKMLPVVYHRTAKKSATYIQNIFGDFEPLFSTREHKVHASHRKMISAPFSLTSVKKMEPLVSIRIHEWISKLDELFANTGKPCLMSDWAIYLTYDVITDLAFGKALGFVKSGTDVFGLIRQFEVGLVIFGFFAKLYPFTQWIFSTRLGKKFLSASEKDKNGFGAMMRVTNELFKQRLHDIEHNRVFRHDLLQAMLDARTDDGEPLDHGFIRTEALFVLMAGADTTGNTLQVLIYHVLREPTIYARLMAELQIATHTGALSPMPLYDEVARLPYMCACVRESLRLFSPPTGALRRVAPKGGLQLGDKHVPEGAEVSTTMWIINSHPDMYAPDPDAFRPERWLDEEKAKDYDKYSFAFGYGSRVCLGKNVAHMELYKAAAQFFRTFRPKLVDSSQPKAIVKGGVFVWKDLWVELERRDTGV